MFRIFFTLFLFLGFSNLFSVKVFEGFPAGTLVRVGEHYKKIEDLKRNDIVSCYNEKGKLVYSNINSIDKHKVDRLCRLKIDGLEQDLICGAAQQFFRVDVPVQKREHILLSAGDLYKDYRILAKDYDSNALVSISLPENRELLFEKRELYTLNVRYHHNFIITEEDIVVHNFGVYVPLMIYSSGKLSVPLAAIFTNIMLACFVARDIPNIAGLRYKRPKTKVEDKSEQSFSAASTGGPKPPKKDDESECKLHQANERHSRVDCERNVDCGSKRMENGLCNNHDANIVKNAGDCKDNLGCSRDTMPGRALDYLHSNESRNAFSNIGDLGKFGTGASLSLVGYKFFRDGEK